MGVLGTARAMALTRRGRRELIIKAVGITEVPLLVGVLSLVVLENEGKTLLFASLLSDILLQDLTLPALPDNNIVGAL